MRADLLRAASLALSFALFVTGLVVAPEARSANTCAAPGRDGPVYLAPTYYPANTLVAPAGSYTVAIGTARLDANASVTPLVQGDLVLVIQMQDGTYSNSNSSGYGDGSSGRGMTSLGTAGRYEFKTVASNLAGIVTFTQPLAYTYTTGPATLTRGQQRYQLVRVPQFSSITISGTVSAPQWDGTTGGVYAIDVAGTLTLNGTIDVSGQGFRGGGGYVNGVLSGNNISDYTGVYPLLPFVTPGIGGVKGEGIGGTPRYVRQQSSLLNGVVDLLISGYPGGYDIGRGAPGNGGGGGDQHNAGGGGGGNAGSGFSTDGGGKGGFSFMQYSATPIFLQTCTAFTSGGTTYYGCGGDGGRDVGGLGGAGLNASIGRLFLGGGGGGGDNNNGGAYPSTPQSGGGNGGGIIFVRASTIAGSGALKADGEMGLDAGKDGAGGGGAGGTIVVHANPGSYNVSASAKGGAGGRTGYLGGPADELEGPGGGGGGGLVITSSGVSIGTQVVSGGAPGTNNASGSLVNVYGANAGGGGVANISASIADPLGGVCLPSLVVNKVASSPTIQNLLGGTALPWIITITNNGPGTAEGVDLQDTLPAGFTYNGTSSAVLNGGATGSTTPGNGGSATVPILGTFTLPAGASVAITLNAALDVALTSGVYTNTGVGRYLDPVRTTVTGKASVISNASVVTVIGIPPLNGYVYLDANHNAVFDANETGLGITGLYVKITLNVAGTCTAPALATGAVDPTTGSYSLGAVAVGGLYCLVLDNNNTLTDVTPYVPPGLVGTEHGSGVVKLPLLQSILEPQNFGFYAGSSISGRVFADNGTGGGTANDGVPNGGETGVPNATVRAQSGATTVSTATTDANGAYTLWLPSTTSGSIAIVAPLSTGTLATGGSAGSTGGTYVRSTNTSTFAFASGNAYAGANFGTVPVNTLQPDGTQAAAPGTAVTYAHAFLAGSAGQVAFTTTTVASPAGVAWSETLYQDVNCNGLADAADPVITGPIAVSAGQRVCIVVKEFVPANAPLGAQNAVSLTATMNYTNASPALVLALSRTDTTVVGTGNTLTLTKQVRNVTTGSAFATSNAASPNDVLEYQVTAANLSAGTVTSVVVNDSTAAYTTFVSAACPASLPPGVTACAIATQPAVGAEGGIRWTFAGSLQSGASVTTTFQVRVSP